MRDARILLDDVRAKMPAEAKALVLWIEPGSIAVHASQANMTQADLGRVLDAIKASTLPPVG
jgi:hypothetical protein